MISRSACILQGDYGFKVLVVDDGDTIATVIDKALEQIGSVLVAPFPQGSVLKLRVQGNDDPIADTTTVSQAGLAEMEAVEVYRAA